MFVSISMLLVVKQSELILFHLVQTATLTVASLSTTIFFFAVNRISNLVIKPIAWIQRVTLEKNNTVAAVLI